MSLTGRHILLGVTGSIAAYKAADICSTLTKFDADIHVVLTESAQKFVGAATFRALTRNSVLTDLFEEPNSRRIAHIDLAQSADLVLVAPASANVIAKLAHGIADDMLTTCLLATPLATPIVIAPAMNTAMWNHPATVDNIEILRRRGAHIIEPGYGMLACQDVGTGKLAEVDEIVRAAVELLLPQQDFAGVTILVTAGATREPLDPVRFLSNRSSGRMGYALAEEAVRRGAEVTIVAGHTSVNPPGGATMVRAESAEQMLTACVDRFAGCSVFIAAAAVADFTPETMVTSKIKKADNGSGNDVMTLRLTRTTDILATVGACKRPDQVVVGFAAETEELVVNARRKLDAKQADLIVANDVTLPGAGFDVETNIVTLVRRDSNTALSILSKREVAARILDEVALLRSERPVEKARVSTP